MTTIQFRRGLSDDWSAKNPVLAEGEPGFESDTGRQKIGDGRTSWTDLAYFINETEVVQKLASDGGVISSDVSEIRVLSQAAYDAISPDSDVLYVVIG